MIRPHPTTDSNALKVLLGFKNKNILTSYAHPLVLLNKALFTIRYGMSSLDPYIINQKRLLLRFYTEELYKKDLKKIKNNKKKTSYLADIKSSLELEKKIREYLHKKNKINNTKSYFVLENNKLKSIINKI